MKSQTVLFMNFTLHLTTVLAVLVVSPIRYYPWLHEIQNCVIHEHHTASYNRSDSTSGESDQMLSLITWNQNLCYSWTSHCILQPFWQYMWWVRSDVILDYMKSKTVLFMNITLHLTTVLAVLVVSPIRCYPWLHEIKNCVIHEHHTASYNRSGSTSGESDQMLSKTVLFMHHVREPFWSLITSVEMGGG